MLNWVFHSKSHISKLNFRKFLGEKIERLIKFELKKFILVAKSENIFQKYKKKRNFFVFSLKKIPQESSLSQNPLKFGSRPFNCHYTMFSPFRKFIRSNMNRTHIIIHTVIRLSNNRISILQSQMIFSLNAFLPTFADFSFHSKKDQSTKSSVTQWEGRGI